MNRKALEMLTRVDLSGVAITAAVGAEGRLAHVGSDFDKLLAAAKERSLPRVHTVIVADSQPTDHLGFVKDRQERVLRDPQAQFHVIKAETLEDAVDLLELDSHTRWGQIIDFAAELHRHRDFIGRDWLIARVQAFLETHESGYLLLTGEPGLGKSAFMSELIRRHGPAAVYHFIKQGMGNWDNPEAMVLSLSAQLRRCFAILKTEEDQKQGATDAFPSLLQRVSDSLAQGQRAVLFIDGLDEAFGPTGRSARISLLSVLPKLLPRGVFVVLTSRPGEQLAWLADSTICTSQPLDPSSADNQTDVQAYLDWRNQTGRLGLETSFIGQLARASEGNFQVAVLYLRDRPDLGEELRRWREDPRNIPRGLTGWLTTLWQRVATTARERGIGESVLRAVMGLLSVAREPLSLNHLAVFVRQAEGKRFGSFRVDQVQERLDDVLGLVAEFFGPVDPQQPATSPYRFFHGSFPDFILKKAPEIEMQDYHRILSAGCLNWREQTGAVQLYSVKHLLYHLASGKEEEILDSVLGDEALHFESLRIESTGSPYHPLETSWLKLLRTSQQFVEKAREILKACGKNRSSEFVILFATAHPVRWVVLAEPGMGKTSLVHGTCSDMLHGRLNRGGLKRLPVAIDLHSTTPSDQWGFPSVSDPPEAIEILWGHAYQSSLPSFLHQLYARPSSPLLTHAQDGDRICPRAKDWETWLERGSVFLLLDGVDACSRSPGQELARYLASELNRFPKTPAILTCRTSEWGRLSSIFPDYEVFEVKKSDVHFGSLTIRREMP